MSSALKRHCLYDSSDEEEKPSTPSNIIPEESRISTADVETNEADQEQSSNLTLSYKLANLKKNQFFSSNSGSETEETCLNSQISEQLNSLSDSSNDSDKNASPVLKRFPTKRQRLWSEESNNDQTEKQSLPQNSTNDYQLSSSSEEEEEKASSSKIVPSNFYPQNSSKNYVVSISRSRLAGPRSSADVKMKNGYSRPDKNSASNKKKKHQRLKWLSSYDEDDVDENFQKNDFSSDSGESDEDGPTISSRMQKKIIDLIQNSSEEELTTISQCSTKKADVLVSLRPFLSWNDLLTKIDNTKALNRNLLYSSVDLIRERAAICRLMEACSKISTKLQAEFDKFQDAGTQSPRKYCEDIVVKSQPSNLNPSLTLKPYQMIGLNWLALLHRNNVNGILADEMGLGKTIQTISFLAFLQSEGLSDGPHLIVVPSSTLDNWIREFGIWCPSFSIVVYHGKQDERKAMRLQLLRGYLDCNVILTTYNIATSLPEDKSLFKKLGVYYAVFDEGHMLKNMSTQRFQYLMKISAVHRLLLTGTPVQNNLLELMSLLRFVMPHMFQETTSSLIRIFSHSGGENSSTFAKQRINHAKLIMQPFVLRRLKREVLHQLPEKIETICKCDLTQNQRKLYEKVKTVFKNKTLKKNMPKSELKNVFVELRKVANHSLLRREHYSDIVLQKMAKLLKKDVVYEESSEVYLFEDMQVMSDFEIHNLCLTSSMIKSFKLTDSVLLDSGKFKKLDEVLPPIKSEGKRILLFSQFTMMMDIIETYLKLRGHKYLRLDGQTPVGERINLIDRFNNDSSYFAFVLSTRAGGLGINLTSASTVILHDIDSNPYNDKQAEDRCHRLGQENDVQVMKLISSDTIEEGMYKCAQHKLRLEQDMQEEDEDFIDMAALITQSLQ